MIRVWRGARWPLVQRAGILNPSSLSFYKEITVLSAVGEGSSDTGVVELATILVDAPALAVVALLGAVEAFQVTAGDHCS